MSLEKLSATVNNINRINWKASNKTTNSSKSKFTWCSVVITITSDNWPHLYYYNHNPARIHSAVDKVFGWEALLTEIIWRLQVQSHQQVKLTRNTYFNFTLVPGYGQQKWNKLLRSNKGFSSSFCGLPSSTWNTWRKPKDISAETLWL